MSSLSGYDVVSIPTLAMSANEPSIPVLRSILKPDSLVELSVHERRKEPAQLCGEKIWRSHAKSKNSHDFTSDIRCKPTRFPPFAHNGNTLLVEERSNSATNPMQVNLIRSAVP